MRPIHIVVGFTPYHALFSERLIPIIDGDVVCAFTKSWPSIKGYRKIIYIWPNHKLLRSVTYGLSLISFLARLRFWQFCKRPIHAYVPHPCNAFSYAIFASKELASLSIYEDGLANYYDAAVPKQECLNSVERIALSIFGFKNLSMRGHIGGYEIRPVDKLFLSRGELAVSKEKVGCVLSLPFTSREEDLSPNKILFLDQDTSQYISQSERKERLDMLFDKYSPVDYEYIYKPHHDFNVILPAMRSLTGLQEKVPAELLVSEISAGVVVSFYSSALLNLKNIYPGIKCVSIGGDAINISVDGKAELLSDFFRRHDIECLTAEVK